MTDRVPSANNPQLLTRLVGAIASGLRTTPTLREALGVQAQTVRNYVHAARWLGFAMGDDPLRLTALGLAYAYAGQRQQQLYVQAVWSNPAAADLLVASDGRLPDVPHVERMIREGEPDLAEATVRRRASAVRGLIAPAVGRSRPHPPAQDELQLALPLGHAAAGDGEPPPPAAGARSDDPDVYRYVWSQLLDHGELRLAHLEGILARAGVAVDPAEAVLRAQARGDAVLHDDRLVITAASVRRRSLSASTSSVILSDPDYRAYLRLLVATRGQPGPPGFAQRFAAWDRWLFGGPASPADVEAALRGLLLERSLEAFPVARGDALPPPVATAPFLRTWDLPGLPLAFPPTLRQLLGGAEAVARLEVDSEVPSVVTAPAVVHAGLRAPEEAAAPLPADAEGLRARAVRTCPAAALLAALLLLHRQRPHRLAVGHASTGWGVHLGASEQVPLGEFLASFADHRRWVFARRPTGGVGANTLVGVAEALGIAERVGRLAVLTESLAVQLPRADAGEALQALADALASWVDQGGGRR